MFGDPLKTTRDRRAARKALPATAPAAESTACQGTAADTSPDELSMLADQVIGFRKSARMLRVQCALEQLRSYVAGHLVITALAVALPLAVLSFLWR